MSDKRLCMIPQCLHAATATIHWCPRVCALLGYRDGTKFEEEVCDGHGSRYVDYCHEKPQCKLGPMGVRS